MGEVAYYDPVSGARLAEPQVLRVTPDRQPYSGVPEPGGTWWTALIERGWLQLPPPDRGQQNA
ncbi:hypothetical protein [Nonomuraea sp. NPDC049750]|uniref:hypothetical protein n=1 Tax=Nonomuraea sp. NPDC049750 TaxID=3154738 RepID=UPI0033C13821